MKWGEQIAAPPNSDHGWMNNLQLVELYNRHVRLISSLKLGKNSGPTVRRCKASQIIGDAKSFEQVIPRIDSWSFLISHTDNYMMLPDIFSNDEQIGEHE